MPERLLNFAHLERLSEDILHDGQLCRVVHIYCHYPDFRCVADPEEGMACVDDVARAAVLYLRHFELTGHSASRRKAEAMLRFILYMQAPSGLFYNFVINRGLEINRTHIRSRAERVEWWTARAVWALGTACRALRTANPVLAKRCAESACRVLPHVSRLLEEYPKADSYLGRTVPRWLLYGDGADATSELILGLVRLRQHHADGEVQLMIDRLGEGIALMRYGGMNRFPFGLHASNRHCWHKWGNSQTQALAEAGLLDSAAHEANEFYPRLLIEGLLHSIWFDRLHAIRYYERIAYGVRSIAVGLVRLFEQTGEIKYARMAGLAASWLLGNNTAGAALYDCATGRCCDALMNEKRVNQNAGAESTIEALHTILEVQAIPEARCWLHVQAEPAVRLSRHGEEYLYRTFRTQTRPHRSVGVILNLTHESLQVLTDEQLEEFVKGADPELLGLTPALR